MTDLIADIGGTNLRFALIENGRIVREASFGWPQPPSISAAARQFLDGTTVTAAAFAVAAPITGGDILFMPNVATGDGHGWSFSLKQLKTELGVSRLEVVNDFTAIALAIPHLAETDRVQIGDEGRAAPHAPIGVMGAGTGLGVSALVWTGSTYTALAAEGGHVTMPAISDRESDVLALLRKKFTHVSAERLCSGQGLVNLYESLQLLDRREPERRSPAEISTLALSRSDPACVEAVEMFCAMLGTVAGNLALTLGARGGVYIAGGIVPKILPLFRHSRFRKRFTEKGRYHDYQAAIPTFVVTHDNPAYLGLMNLLKDHG
jgi:glucokinase